MMIKNAIYVAFTLYIMDAHQTKIHIYTSK